MITDAGIFCFSLNGVSSEKLVDRASTQKKPNISVLPSRTVERRLGVRNAKTNTALVLRNFTVQDEFVVRVKIFLPHFYFHIKFISNFTVQGVPCLWLYDI